ncbi:MAG: hypothetical protein JWN25_699, partial [Verrucomicrobiales bacterium]|nr:hypothetical protein [Verrucomicrobiales bacterium]
MLFGCNEKPATPTGPNSGDPELAITLTPWIDPERILAEFFTATSHAERVKFIFSGVRSELAMALHRELTPSDNLLVVYKIHDGGHFQGMVVPQKVKGSTGSMEIVVVIGEDLRVRGVKFQKYRGSEVVRKALDSKFEPLLKSSKEFQYSSLDGLSQDAREDGAAILKAVDSIVTKLRLARDNPKVIQ